MLSLDFLFYTLSFCCFSRGQVPKLVRFVQLWTVAAKLNPVVAVHVVACVPASMTDEHRLDSDRSKQTPVVAMVSQLAATIGCDI